jgi:hypothetical protein
MNELIKYNDLGTQIDKHTKNIVWNDSNADKTNTWLDSIYYYAKEKSIFYGTSKERDCGWYIDKKSILNVLCNNIPKTNDNEFKADLRFITNDLQNFILNYKEPQKELQTATCNS